VLAACLVIVSHSGPGLAQDTDDSTRNAARNLAGQGKESFASGRFDEARDLFHRAYTLVAAPTIALYEARALVKLHRFVEAEEAYMKALRTKLDPGASEQFRTAVTDAESELLALRPNIPRLTIVVSGGGAEDPGLVVLLDGAPVKHAVLGVETPADPRDHELTATAPGGQPAALKFSLAEKEQKRVEIAVPAGSDVAAAPAAPPAAPAAAAAPDGASRQKILGFVVGGVGVAGLATGLVTGAMATSRYSEAEGACRDHVCMAGSAGADALQSFRSLRTVSTIAYIVGGVGLAAGATILFTAPSQQAPRSAGLHPWVGASAVGLDGAF
jgi:hypothetical protein